MAKAASSGSSKGGGKGGRGQGPRSPLPPPSGQRTGARQFARESWGELRKVQWPTAQQVMQGTLVVIVVAAVFALFIFLVDQVAGRGVQELYALLTD